MIATKQQVIQQFQQATWEKDHVLEARARQFQELNQQLAAATTQFQQNLQHLQQEVDKVLQQLKATQKGQLILSWKMCRAAARKMYRGSATAYGSTAYFRPGGSSQVLSYNSNTEEWSTLLECFRGDFTLTVVNGLVTAVGGRQSGKCTNTLLSIMEEKWMEYFPPMPTERQLTAVVCSRKTLVVAGGYGEGYVRLATVEVMDTDTLKWSTASSLPHPLSDASATVCADNIYLVGGWDQHGQTKSVLTCSLSALLQSQTVGARMKGFFRTGNHSVWHTITDLPVERSTCVTLSGQLLAVGGYDFDETDSNNIYSYNIATNSWQVISHMLNPQSYRLVALLPGNKMMVVGGWTGYKDTDKVEVATVL